MTVPNCSLDHNCPHRLNSSDRTNVISRSVIKKAFHGNIRVTIDVYAREYKSGKMDQDPIGLKVRFTSHVCVESLKTP